MSQYPRILGVEFVIIQQDACQPSEFTCLLADGWTLRGRVPDLSQAVYRYTQPAFLSILTSVVDVRVHPIRTAHTTPSPHSSYPEPPSSGENSKRTDPVEHHGMSPVPEGVSHPNILLFTPRRLTDLSSESPWKIELISIYRDF